jgi:hypothetical protein
MSFGRTRAKKRLAGKARRQGARAEQLSQPRTDLHRVLGDMPFPLRDAARLDGAAEPLGIGEQRWQGAVNP